MNKWSDIARDDTVIVEATAPSFPVMEAVFRDSADDIKITNLLMGEFVRVDYDFEEGDVLIIDHRKGFIEINGERRMPALDIASEFFALTPGKVRIMTDPDVVDAFMTWEERWL